MGNCLIDNINDNSDFSLAGFNKFNGTQTAATPTALDLALVLA
jgi:hypothetical protein